MNSVSKSLRVVEAYRAVEGEGVMIGTPEVIVRLFGCNLTCSYCDEERSWVHGIIDPAAISVFEDPAALVRHVRATIKSGGAGEKWVSLTGGEPMFRDPTLLSEFVVACHLDGLKVSVHTNGSIHHPPLMPLVDFWSVTPTLSSSENPALGSGTHMRALEGIFAHFRATLSNQRQDRAELKFAIGTLDDVDDAVEIARRLGPSLDAAGIPVVVQPVWPRTAPASASNAYGSWGPAGEVMAWLAQLQEMPALRAIPRVRFLPQLHKLVRGVAAPKS